MLDDRFWTKVDKKGPNDCWLWTANKNNKGYGLFRPGGTAPKQLAHRLSYVDANAPLRRGQLVLHSCDNPTCVNPAHLRAGSYKENVSDMDNRGRRVVAPRCGEANNLSVYTSQEVINIRLQYVRGVPLAEIAVRFSCQRATLKDITSGRSWAHLLGKDGCPSLDDLKSEGARRRRNSARLDQQAADEIRCRLKAGETGASLATEFQVSRATISNIKTGRIWPPH